MLDSRAPGGADVFAVSFAATAGRGGKAGEAFVRYLPTGAILWALVDGQDLDEITVHTARGTFDLMA